ncbi:hypothetical protein [Martelella sp. AD-3]|uniref:hypothetical protein n=1 Tax=Martelella sp. AD-3 TaxID=686597 RepID=UPI000462FC34|nr:hypothetical protein [Martelella sp. AD-3]AMM83987.1 hypothetical protein AZF01_06105 [Martelella sp. AD-3]
MEPKQTAPEYIYPLSTMIEVVGVKQITFNKWRIRNGLFPRTKQEKGWSYYSVADICTATAVKGLIAQGAQAKFAIRAAMALLPRFEAMDKAARGHKAEDDWIDRVLKHSVAVIMSDDDADEHEDAEVSVEFYPIMVPLKTVLKTADNRNRIGWNAASFLDLFEIYKSVLFSLQIIKLGDLVNPAALDRMSIQDLFEALQANH